MRLDQFLVCGLGNLGQHCVLSLKEFGVRVIAIEQIQPQSWEVPSLLDVLDDLIIGDCRQNSILEQAKIKHCRAALLVTTSEQVNAETALAIRQLNPHTRLVVRSAKTNLNELLSRQLGNFIAYDSTELPAQSFALAALGTETVGFFSLDGQWLRVIQEQISQDHPWSYKRLLHELNTRNRRILAHSHSLDVFSPGFHQWQSKEQICPGDTLIYIETTDQFFRQASQDPTILSLKVKKTRTLAIIKLLYRNFRQQIAHFWQLSFQQQIHRVALICSFIVLVLLLVGTVLFHRYYPKTSWLSAFSGTAILMLGGYGDLFGDFEDIAPIPWWLQSFALALNLAGTAFVGVLYAVLTQAMLSAKFQFTKQRPPIPKENHIVIVGMGRVGQQVAAFLQQLKQALVGVTFNHDFNDTSLPDLPLIFGNMSEALAKANLPRAKSVVVVTDDEIFNLEVALMVQAVNPHSHLVIRTSGKRLSQHLMALLPRTHVLGMYAVAAEVFAGAAFGENIINLFRFHQQTILVTEYQIEAGDTLNSLLLAEVAYGYGVVPILHQRSTNLATLMPSEDILLENSDRLIVLATIESLQRVEVGNRHRQGWQVRVENANTDEAAFEGANTISRISGCSLNAARELMNHLPGVLDVPLYKQQAERLIRALGKLQVISRLLPRISEKY